MYSQLVHSELVFFKQTFSDQEDFFKKAGTFLLQEDYVTTSFHNEVVKREKEYPTGLELPKISIAIPHTYPANIVKPFIAIYHLTKPIIFTQMATTDVKVASKLIMVLGIKVPDEQVGLLAKIIDLMSDDKFVNAYKKIQNQQELYHLFKSKL